jgi:cyclohexyl-isocyanide hydratase
MESTICASAEAGEMVVHVMVLVFDSVTQLDFTGPLEVLQRLPGACVSLVSSHGGNISAEKGFLVIADTLSFANVTQRTTPVDVLVIPGGPGVDALLECQAHCEFVREQASSAKHVLSVCTGALLLCAAGVLQPGTAACTHWASREVLRVFGVEPLEPSTRVAVSEDTRLVTCTGVCAGLDGALLVAKLLCGEAEMNRIQLMIEHDPRHGGSPATARAEILEELRARLSDRVQERESIAQRVVKARRGT